MLGCGQSVLLSFNCWHFFFVEFEILMMDEKIVDDTINNARVKDFLRALLRNVQV
jgi:hypothetical protein